MTTHEWRARLLPRKGWILVDVHAADHWVWVHRDAPDLHWNTASFTHPSGEWREDFEPGVTLA